MSSCIAVDPEVVCVTLNPAFDLTGHLPGLSLGELNRVESASFYPAGKGINVAKLLAQLGAKVSVSGFLGASNEAEFVKLFKQLGVADDFIRVMGATRINVKLVEQDPNNSVTEINFPSFCVDQHAFDQLRSKLLALSKTKPLVVLAGSLPTGVTPQQCAELITELQALGCRVVFDSSKAALYQGVKAAPYLVKPNQLELAELLDCDLTSSDEIAFEQIIQAAQQIRAQGCTNVVVSLGEQGVVWINEQGPLFAKPPGVPVVSTVGAGDSLVAGLCWGELQNWSKQASLGFATALAANAVSQVGVGVGDINEILRLARNIEIRAL